MSWCPNKGAYNHRSMRRMSLSEADQLRSFACEITFGLRWGRLKSQPSGSFVPVFFSFSTWDHEVISNQHQSC
jgi:hypothetical protein